MTQPQQAFVNLQAPVVSAALPPTNGRYKKGWQGRVATGVILIVCGLISIGLGIPGAAVYFAFLSWSVWGGIWYIITGSLGAASGGNNSCLVVSYMVMSIISAISAAGQCLWEIYLTIVFTDQSINGFSGLHLGAAVVAGIILIVSITGAVYCCCGTCCSDPQSASNQVVIQYQPQPAQTTVPYTTQGAPSQYPSQYPPQQPGQYPPPGYYAHPPPANPYMELRK